MNKHRELLTSIRRYYSNAFTDRAKQDAINLFLGYYVPNSTDKPLWELDTDYYLHNFHAENAGLQSMREYKKDQYCLDQDEVICECRQECNNKTSYVFIDIAASFVSPNIISFSIWEYSLRVLSCPHSAACPLLEP